MSGEVFCAGPASTCHLRLRGETVRYNPSALSGVRECSQHTSEQLGRAPIKLVTKPGCRPGLGAVVCCYRPREAALLTSEALPFCVPLPTFPGMSPRPRLIDRSVSCVLGFGVQKRLVRPSFVARPPVSTGLRPRLWGHFYSSALSPCSSSTQPAFSGLRDPPDLIAPLPLPL